MSDALFQNSFYIGNNFNWILYGVNFVLYVQTISLYARSEWKSRKSTRFFIGFSTVALILITIYVAVESVFGQEMWIVNADYPGGSAAYLAANAAVWYETMGTTCSVILQLMSDGLLIYRCYIVWSSRKVIILPCFLWLATLVFGIFNLYTSGSPNSDFFVGFAVWVNVIYTSTSIGLNTLVTCLICGRILYYARRLGKRLGPAVSETYFSTIALIVESALPYTLFGIAFVVTDGLNNGTSIMFLSLYAMFMVLSPQMLILRVASGKAWNSRTATHAAGTASSLAFEKYTNPKTSITVTATHNEGQKATRSADVESGLGV